jgi:hypothetical protein
MDAKLIRYGGKALALAALASLGVGAAQASTVHFDVQGTGYALATGNTYGSTDSNSNPNHVLGVTFAATAPDLHQVANLTAGQSLYFQFGTVAISEEGNSGNNSGAATITQDEILNLGVNAVFKFLEPVSNPGFSITGLVTATLGRLADDAVDYAIDWADTTVSFGNGGQFTLSLDDVAFTRNNMSMGQWATLTLVSAPTAPNNGGNTGGNTGGNAVPEPGSLALAGLGLGVAGFISRRRKQQA